MTGYRIGARTTCRRSFCRVNNGDIFFQKEATE